MELSFSKIFVELFLFVGAFGSIPIFLSFTKGYSKKEANKTALWVAINVCVILIISFFVGKILIEDVLGININALRVAGGVIICMAGLSLLKGNAESVEHKEIEKPKKKTNVALTPLAIPLMAGPAAMSLLINLNEKCKETTDVITVLGAVLLVCLAIFVMLRFSNYISSFLGESGMDSVSRITGFVVLAIGIQSVIMSLSDIFGLATIFSK